MENGSPFSKQVSTLANISEKDLFSRECNGGQFTVGNEVAFFIGDLYLPKLGGPPFMDNGCSCIDISFLNGFYMVGGNLYPPHKKLLCIQKYIGGSTAHTLCQCHGCPSVKYAIRLVHFWGDRHACQEKILPDINIGYVQSFHQCSLGDGITNGQNLLFVFVHPLIFCKITQSYGNIEPSLMIMSQDEKTVAYTTENIYLTLNTITAKTKNVWLVFHGIGYLSRYFVNYFKDMDPTENYIIVPQAPSKYYLKDEYKYVGASWLTKENTAMEIQNVFR